MGELTSRQTPRTATSTLVAAVRGQAPRVPHREELSIKLPVSEQPPRTLISSLLTHFPLLSCYLFAMSNIQLPTTISEVAPAPTYTVPDLELPPYTPGQFIPYGYLSMSDLVGNALTTTPEY
ncbi:hypothetical protein NLI96_g7194 [Meripilus lineatus]|uniref:Uncharacterized protein n=1 Tax=Meripilus lineatus TaxID=2056292 RepID=A0AAD5YD66_9APHY|nr:hypothetical protein NLI96_g7194 [Physisporinus lineatus]